MAGEITGKISLVVEGEHIIMDDYKEVAEKNFVEMKTHEEKTKKVFLVVIVFVIIFFFALFAWFAGRNIGEDLGEFIYNISH